MKETTKELFLKAAKLFVKEGRYLKPPHGRLIWEGKKTLIVTKRRFRGEDKPRGEVRASTEMIVTSTRSISSAGR